MAEVMASLREAFGEALAELALGDERVLVLDGDLANSTRIDIVDERAPGQFLEMGIAEQNMVGVAAGLATLGYRPWVCSFATFLAKRSLDQFKVSVLQPRLPVVLAGAYAGLLNGRNGKTHQALIDVAIMRSLPGVTVLAPVDALETRQMVNALGSHERPSYLRLTRDPAPLLDEVSFRIGAPRLLRRGTSDVALISTGVQSSRALEAADRVADSGLSVHVVHLPTISPLDTEELLDLLLGISLVVTVEDHAVTGGIGSLMAELLSEHRPTRVIRLGLHDYGESGSNDDLLDKYTLSAPRIADQIQRLAVHR